MGLVLATTVESVASEQQRVARIELGLGAVVAIEGSARLPRVRTNGDRGCSVGDSERAEGDHRVDDVRMLAHRMRPAVGVAVRKLGRFTWPDLYELGRVEQMRL